MTPSPCINLCQMDPSNDLCRGCFRNIDEITAWSRLDDPARIHILAEIAKRRLAHVQRQTDFRSTDHAND